MSKQINEFSQNFNSFFKIILSIIIYYFIIIYSLVSKPSKSKNSIKSKEQLSNQFKSMTTDEKALKNVTDETDLMKKTSGCGGKADT